jgi:lycopene cyclase domain-containing protein
MFGPLTYLLWLLIFIFLPLFALVVWQRQVWRQWRALGLSLAGSLMGGWAWDAVAVRRGLWFYHPGNIVGVWIAGLPIEEWLWIVGVTLLFGVVTVVVAERTGVGNRA